MNGPQPDRAYNDYESITTLMDISHIIGVMNIHTLSVDLEADYERATWNQMREKSLVNSLTGKPYIDIVQLRRLIKILKAMEYSPYDMTCYIPKAGCKPFLVFPYETCELFYGIAPKIPSETKYNLVPIQKTEELQ